MRLKFSHKVFLTLFLNGLVIVACMLLIGRYYAHRNFEEYIEKVEMERLDKLAEALSREYQKSGSWDLVLGDWDHWLQMARIGPGLPPRAFIAGEPSFPPPPPMGIHPKEGPPPPFGEPPGFPPGPPPHSGPMPPRALLFDAQKQPLTPRDQSPTESYRMKTIVANGQVVGWLGTGRPKGPMHPLDIEFLRHQSLMLYSTAGVSLILAILVTSLLSRHLLAPLKELAKGTRALTSRRFDTRIQIRSRDEFGQLASDFNAMAQALERHEQMRRQWIADTSHELRTPLAILRGEIEAMQDGVRETTPQALDSLHFEVLHLSRIVHDLHEISLLDSQAFEAEKTAVDPLEVLRETLGSFDTKFVHCNMKIEANGESASGVRIMADTDRLKQLFSNLLENTLRYAHAPGVLKIFCELTPDLLLLHFEDSGPGVPEESLGRLFDRLYRVDKARSRAQGGSGLGLAICKSIVEGCGGRIEACNVPSGGLRVTIVFPLLSA